MNATGEEETWFAKVKALFAIGVQEADGSTTERFCAVVHWFNRGTDVVQANMAIRVTLTDKFGVVNLSSIIEPVLLIQDYSIADENAFVVNEFV